MIMCLNVSLYKHFCMFYTVTKIAFDTTIYNIMIVTILYNFRSYHELFLLFNVFLNNNLRVFFQTHLIHIQNIMAYSLGLHNERYKTCYSFVGFLTIYRYLAERFTGYLLLVFHYYLRDEVL